MAHNTNSIPNRFNNAPTPLEINPERFSRQGVRAEVRSAETALVRAGLPEVSRRAWTTRAHNILAVLETAQQDADALSNAVIEAYAELASPQYRVRIIAQLKDVAKFDAVADKAAVSVHMDNAAREVLVKETKRVLGGQSPRPKAPKRIIKSCYHDQIRADHKLAGRQNRADWFFRAEKRCVLVTDELDRKLVVLVTKCLHYPMFAADAHNGGFPFALWTKQLNATLDPSETALTESMVRERVARVLHDIERADNKLFAKEFSALLSERMVLCLGDDNTGTAL